MPIKINVLVVDETFPSKTRDSGSLDGAVLIESLLHLNFQVTFLPLSYNTSSTNYKDYLIKQGLNVCPESQIDQIENWLLSREIFDIIIISRVNVANKCIDFLRLHFPKAKFIFNTVDVHHVREEREAKIKNDKILLEKSERTKSQELNIISKCDATIVISKAELIYLNNIIKNSKIIYLPMGRDYPLEMPNYHERRDILFIGSFAWEPNVNGMIYFLNNIWPKVLQIDRNIRLKIIGYGMPHQLKNLSEYNVDGIGFVDDLTPYINSHRLSIAPLLFGAGTKGKVIQSITHGLPVIGSRVSGEGLINEFSGIAVTDDPFNFSQLIIHFHNNENAWNYLHRQCLAHRTEYSIDKYRENLIKIISDFF